MICSYLKAKKIMHKLLCLLLAVTKFSLLKIIQTAKADFTQYVHVVTCGKYAGSKVK